MSAEFEILLGLYVLLPLGGFVGRNFIKNWIERGVRHHFDGKIEQLRSELRNTEEEFKSEIRAKEAEIAALRDGVLSGRTQRQALVDKRRLDAIERTWSAINALAPFKGVSGFMAVINFEAASKETPRDPKLRQFFATISGPQVADLTKFQNPAKDERPFVSDLAWAYFSAYEMIVFGAYMRAKALELGIENPGQLLDDAKIKAVVKAALPHQSDFIEQYDPLAYHHLLEELEGSLLTELQKMLRGEDQDAAGVAQAARIMDLVRQNSAESSTHPVL